MKGVTIKAGELMGSLESLKSFAAMDVPIKLGFKLQKILRKVQTEIDGIQKMRQKTLDKFTEKDENGKVVHPLDAVGKPILSQMKLTDPEGHRAAMQEIDDTEITMGFEPLAESDLGDKLVVKTGVLMALHWLFKE